MSETGSSALYLRPPRLRYGTEIETPTKENACRRRPDRLRMAVGLSLGSAEAHDGLR